MEPTQKTVSRIKALATELMARTTRALEIIDYIIERDAKHLVHDNDLERARRALKHGSRYKGMYGK